MNHPQHCPATVGTTEIRPSAHLRKLRRALTVLAFGPLLLIGGCSPAPPTEPAPSPTASSTPTELDRFRKACAEGLPVDWRPAQVVYPKTLEANLGESVAYEVAIDARDARPPAEQVITVENGSTGTREVAVRCRLAAKVETSSDYLAVDPDTTDWAYRDFSSTGVVQWAWLLTPKKPADQQAILTIRPAIDMSGTEGDSRVSYGGNANTELTLITDVKVNATFIEQISFWFETQWVLLTGVAVVVGAAILGFVNWSGDLKDKITAKWLKPKSTADEKDATGEDKAPKT